MFTEIALSYNQLSFIVSRDCGRYARYKQSVADFTDGAFDVWIAGVSEVLHSHDEFLSDRAHLVYVVSDYVVEFREVCRCFSWGVGGPIQWQLRLTW